jgi:hypothetical protein
MFKTALRLSALMLIVVGSFYCGRATAIKKPEAVARDQNATTLFTLSDLPNRSRETRKIEFRLQQSFVAIEWRDVDLPSFPSPSKHVPNDPDVQYRLTWNEQTERFLFDGKPLDYKPEITFPSCWRCDWRPEPPEAWTLWLATERNET